MDTITTAPNSDIIGNYGTALPSDLASATREIISLRIENTDLKRRYDEIREQIRIMQARRYGRSSEKLSAEDIRQGLLFDEAEIQANVPVEPVPRQQFLPLNQQTCR